MKSFVSETERFLAKAYWLTDADAPAVMTLLAVAQTLDDDGVQAALIAQYRMQYNWLMKRQGSVAPKDELEELLG